ncbi:L-azetidine-2-carboxylic acid acetyltransferase-like protein, partial [Leptotrombidium deliense]
MTTAYVLNAKKDIKFEDLPEIVTTKFGEKYVFDEFQEKDFSGLCEIFKEVVEEGKSYPQDFCDESSFRAYFLSHNCFVVRKIDNEAVVAGIYIKPNFPGRSAHIANAGLVIKMDYRKKALGDILMEKWQSMGKRLGFEAAYSNLVFATNTAMIKLMQRHGFVKVGQLP